MLFHQIRILVYMHFLSKSSSCCISNKYFQLCKTKNKNHFFLKYMRNLLLEIMFVRYDETSSILKTYTFDIILNAGHVLT